MASPRLASAHHSARLLKIDQGARHIHLHAGNMRWRPVRATVVQCDSKFKGQGAQNTKENLELPDDFSRSRPIGADPAAPSSIQQGSDGAANAMSNADNGSGECLPPPASLGERWESLPARYKVVVATSLAFVICNMDKVNISVAIIPMAKEFGWSPTTAGLVQSSFFYGYLLSQLPGGYLSSILGGRSVLPAGVAIWSAATAGVPFLASTVPGLFLSRAAVGFGEGVAPSAATDIVARIIDTTERSRAISFIFGGLHVGSLLGLIVAPFVIERLGWPTVFYLFGGFGLMWSLWWERLVASIKGSEPKVAAALAMPGGMRRHPASDSDEDGTAPMALDLDSGSQGPRGVQHATTTASTANSSSRSDHAGSALTHGGHGGVIPHDEAVPWRSFLRNGPVRALSYTHFCNNWFHYTMLAWLPTYFSDILDVNLMGAAKVSILPPIAAIVVAAVAGPLADGLIARGVALARVRKSAQCAAFLGPAACLSVAGVVDNGDLAVALITLSLGLASFSLAGLYCNHADLSPRYAPVLLGLTNTSGALPGIIGVAVTGWLYDVTGSWPLALFAPSIFFFLTGSAVYVRYGSAQRQDFAVGNQPFAMEALWLGRPAGGAAAEGRRARPEEAEQNGAKPHEHEQ